jgi:LysM repeat protein
MTQPFQPPPGLAPPPLLQWNPQQGIVVPELVERGGVMPEVLLRDPETGDELVFPTNPAEIATSSTTEPRSVQLDNFGSLSRPFGRAPATFRFSGVFWGGQRAEMALPSFLPRTKWRRPKDCRTMLERWLDRQPRRPPLQPLEFSVTGWNLPPILVKVFIQSLGFTWRGGYGDLAYEVELTEWRGAIIAIDGEEDEDPESEEYWNQDDEAGQSGDTEVDPPIPAEYIVQPGDTLWSIAQSNLGDGSQWEAIWSLEANREQIGVNPDLLEPGMVLVLPGGTDDPSSAAPESPALDVSYEEIAQEEGQTPGVPGPYNFRALRRRRSY